MSANLAMVLDRVDKIADVIRDGAAESERLGHLAPAVIDALHEADLFRILIPADLGGLALTLPESIAVFERVASHDASTGWTLAILADGPLFQRQLPRETFATLCDPLGLVAGTANPATTRAEPVEGGFLFSGRASYLSGSAHAQWVMAAALVMRDGQPAVSDAGIEIRAGLFPIELARCLDTWHVTGMRATGSSDYAFENVMVPTEMTFEPFRHNASSDDAFGAIPIWALLGSGLTACTVGAARNMIDRFVELAAAKVPAGNFSRLCERAQAQIAVGEAEGLYLAARSVLTESVNTVWERGEAREPFDNDVLARWTVQP